MKNIAFVIGFFATIIFAFMPESAFPQAAAPQKINLTWVYNYGASDAKNKPKPNPKLDHLRKITYRCQDKSCLGGYTVRFEDGGFYERKKDEIISVEFADGAYGDLNGDGRNDAVVFLETSSGGSGTWVIMAIVMNKGGKFVNTDCINIGDREMVNSVMIQPNRVTADMRLHLSGEPSCCPESPFKLRFKVSQAGRILNKQTFYNVTDAGAELYLGDIAMWGKDYNKAIGYYSKAIGLCPEYKQAYLRRADTRMDQGKYNLALMDYNTALRLDNQDIEAYRGRAYCHLRLKQNEKCIQDIAHAIQKEPNDAYSYRIRAAAHENLGKYREAINDDTQSISLSAKMKPEPCGMHQNDHEAALLARGQNYARVGDFGRALVDLDTLIKMPALKENGDDICMPAPDKYKSLKGPAYYTRGLIHAKLRNFPHAVRDLSAYISTTPQNTVSETAYHVRGACYFETDAYGPALKDFEGALRLSKENERKLDNMMCLASIYSRQNDKAKASQYYRKALKIEPRLRHSSQVLEKRGFVHLPKMKDAIAEITRKGM